MSQVPQDPAPGEPAPEAVNPDQASAHEAASIYGRAGIVTLFTLLSRILGMTRDLVIAHKFGASGATDAWVQAFRIPNALRRLTAEGSMTIAFIPIYVSVRESEGRVAARVFAQQVLGLVLLLTALISAAGMVFSPALTALVSPGFMSDPEKFDIAVSMMRWTFPYLLLVSVVAWAMGVLNSEHSFAAPAASPMLLNVGIIAAVVMGAAYMERPIMAIAAGVLAGGIGQVLLQLQPLGRHQVLPRPRMQWWNPHVRRLFRLLAPSLAGLAVYELNIIILGIIASYLPTGQIFHYNNATRLTELVWGLFAYSFTVAGFPTLSEHYAREDWPRMRETLKLTCSALMFTVIPAMAGIIAIAPAVVSMLYLHGAYTVEDVRMTANALRLLALGIPAVALVRLMVPVFYAFGDARTPVLVSGATLIVTGGLGWVLSRQLEVLGLALGLSLGVWFQCIVLWLMLRYRASVLGKWFPWRSAMLQGAVAGVMGGMAFWVADFGDWSMGPFSTSNWILFSSVLIVSVFLYLFVTLRCGDSQARHWLELIQRQMKKGGRFISGAN